MAVWTHVTNHWGSHNKGKTLRFNFLPGYKVELKCTHLHGFFSSFNCFLSRFICVGVGVPLQSVICNSAASGWRIFVAGIFLAEAVVISVAAAAPWTQASASLIQDPPRCCCCHLPPLLINDEESKAAASVIPNSILTLYTHTNILYLMSCVYFSYFLPPVYLLIENATAEALW